jgi:hypothetical protein
VASPTKKNLVETSQVKSLGKIGEKRLKNRSYDWMTGSEKVKIEPKVFR